jgi:hypothetical protein
MEFVELEREPFDVADQQKVLVLPEGGDGVRAGAYSSTAISLYKALNGADIETGFLTNPERLLEQRGAEWFGPALLFFTSIYTSNPDVFSQAMGLIKHHVQGLYPSVPDPKIRLDVHIQQSKSKKTTSISYRGGVEGLEILAEKLEVICRNGTEEN